MQHEPRRFLRNAQIARQLARAYALFVGCTEVNCNEPIAQFNLAVMHQNGWGVPMDEAEAIRLYTLAADAGEGAAMVAVGRYYAMDFSDSVSLINQSYHRTKMFIKAEPFSSSAFRCTLFLWG